MYYVGVAYTTSLLRFFFEFPSSFFPCIPANYLTASRRHELILHLPGGGGNILSADNLRRAWEGNEAGSRGGERSSMYCVVVFQAYSLGLPFSPQ